MVIPIKNVVAIIIIKIRLKIVIMNVGQHYINFPTIFFQHFGTWHTYWWSICVPNHLPIEYDKGSYKNRRFIKILQLCLDIDEKHYHEAAGFVKICAKFGTRWHTCATPCAKIALKPIFAEKRVTSSQTSNDWVFRIEFERISAHFTYSWASIKNT